MSKLQTFLDKLTDRELAIFYAQRYAEFSSESQKRIQNEISQRSLNVSESQVAEYLGEHESTEGNCPKCGSSHFYSQKEADFATDVMVGTFEVNVKMRDICQVCGYKD